MNETIFNIHDLVLMMTAVQCACFAALLVFTNPPKNKSNYRRSKINNIYNHLIIYLFVCYHKSYNIYIKQSLISFISNFFG